MRKTIATLTQRGEWKVVYDESAKWDKYKVYYVYHDNFGRHQLIVRSYADLASAMYLLAQIAGANFGYNDVMEYLGIDKRIWTVYNKAI